MSVVLIFDARRSFVAEKGGLLGGGLVVTRTTYRPIQGDGSRQLTFIEWLFVHI